LRQREPVEGIPLSFPQSFSRICEEETQLIFLSFLAPIQAIFVENTMFEDKSATELSYVDFLCYIHKEIQNEISD